MPAAHAQPALCGIPAVPPAEHFMLPPDYVQRPAALGIDSPETGTYWTPDRLANTARYQAHVYRWADSLATRFGLQRILDVGCGVGIKLAGMLAKPGRSLFGVDQAAAVEEAQRLAPGPIYWAADLENPEPCGEHAADSCATGFDLVICADVIEHLADPDPLIAFVCRVLSADGLLVLSTPDRDRLRGRGCRQSPKPDHVREWARDEFIAFARSRGLHVRASRLMPQDDLSLPASREGELSFRLGKSQTSPRACHALLCARRPVREQRATHA